MKKLVLSILIFAPFLLLSQNDLTSDKLQKRDFELKIGFSPIIFGLSNKEKKLKDVFELQQYTGFLEYSGHSVGFYVNLYFGKHILTGINLRFSNSEISGRKVIGSYWGPFNVETFSSRYYVRHTVNYDIEHLFFEPKIGTTDKNRIFSVYGGPSIISQSINSYTKAKLGLFVGTEASLKIKHAEGKYFLSCFIEYRKNPNLKLPRKYYSTKANGELFIGEFEEQEMNLSNAVFGITVGIY